MWFELEPASLVRFCAAVCLLYDFEAKKRYLASSLCADGCVILLMAQLACRQHCTHRAVLLSTAKLAYWFLQTDRWTIAHTTYGTHVIQWVPRPAAGYGGVC